MSHYWTADDPIETRREQIIDWIDDLVEFGAPVVAEACGNWRRSQSRRPMPADIRRLCIEAQREQRERIALAAPRDGAEWNYEQRRAALQAERERNRDAEAANYGRLRRLQDELAGRRPAGSLQHAAAALGAKAREYTKEELRAGRIALGIEPADAAE